MLRLEFKRNEQSSTEASAMLFVDPQNELRSELTTNCAIAMEPDEVISVPLYFSAQLVGNFELQMETSYLLDGEETVRNGKVTLAITAKEPFVVKSGVLSTNGLPVASLLNNSEHILKVDISSNADIIVTNVEWLLADVLSCIGRDEEITKQVEDQLNDGEVISYCCVVAVHSREEDVECPLGRLAVEWKRVASDSSVRSVVPLCRLLVLPCPVTVEAKVFDSPITVRYPIRINYIISSHSMEAIELTVSFDLSDTFMFCGEKRSTFRLLPRSRRSLNIVVMALSAGRLPFPKILLRSPQVIDTILQQSLRTLPATIFILPCSKGLSNSDA